MECPTCKQKLNNILSKPLTPNDPHWGVVFYWCDTCNHIETKEVDLWKEKYPLRHICRLKISVSKESIVFHHLYKYSGRKNTLRVTRTYKTTKERVWRILQASTNRRYDIGSRMEYRRLREKYRRPIFVY